MWAFMLMTATAIVGFVISAYILFTGLLALVGMIITALDEHQVFGPNIQLKNKPVLKQIMRLFLWWEEHVGFFVVYLGGQSQRSALTQNSDFIQAKKRYEEAAVRWRDYKNQGLEQDATRLKVEMDKAFNDMFLYK